MGGEEIQIDTFDGLLRELLAWDSLFQVRGTTLRPGISSRGLNNNWESWRSAADHGQLSAPRTWVAGVATAAAEG